MSGREAVPRALLTIKCLFISFALGGNCFAGVARETRRHTRVYTHDLIINIRFNIGSVSAHDRVRLCSSGVGIA